VTAPNGERATVFVNRGDQNRFVEFGGDRIGVGFGPRIINLPYRLHLDDFLLLTYPGSKNPASYESHVRLYDGERGEDGREVRIYMNHPLTHRGFKHFQSSYDPDHQGTVLSVNHDPGKWPTYFGYALLTLGFLVLMLKPLLWPKGGRPTRSKA
jgi:cytochrome c biogenesis protein ResB